MRRREEERKKWPNWTRAPVYRVRGAARPRVRPACSDAERRDYSPAVPTTQFTNPLENLQLPHLQYSL